MAWCLPNNKGCFYNKSGLFGLLFGIFEGAASGILVVLWQWVLCLFREETTFGQGFGFFFFLLGGPSLYNLDFLELLDVLSCNCFIVCFWLCPFGVIFNFLLKFFSLLLIKCYSR